MRPQRGPTLRPEIGPAAKKAVFRKSYPCLCDRASSRTDQDVSRAPFIPGLLSVTFRALSAELILTELSQSGLAGIEWGGDSHVPPGDTKKAERIRKWTREAGLAVSAYGSYYAFDELLENPLAQGPSQEAVLDTAEALGTDMIRIWPGRIGSAEASTHWFESVVDATRTFADLATGRGIRLGFEFHNNSLTDSPAATLRLLSAIDRDNVSTFWQTNGGDVASDNLASLPLLRDHISHLHCHHLIANQSPPYAPLHEGTEEWLAYLKAIRTTDRTHWISIEFVKDGSLESFHKDAATLLSWCETIHYTHDDGPH